MNRMPVKTSRTTSGIDWRMEKTCFVYQTPVTSGSAAGSGTQCTPSASQCVPVSQPGSQGGAHKGSPGSHGGGSGGSEPSSGLTAK